nr:ankyrin-like protein [Melanopsichium pennsylvanicum 4]
MTSIPNVNGSNVAAAPFQHQVQPRSHPKFVTQLSDAAIDLANRMFDLARRGDLALIDYLASGLPPNLTNNRGDSLLMLASYHGHADLVQRMLTQSHSPSSSAQNTHRGWRGTPDPNQLNGRGQSIVAGAVFKGYDHVVRLLIQHGADPLAGQPNAE